MPTDQRRERLSSGFIVGRRGGGFALRAECCSSELHVGGRFTGTLGDGVPRSRVHGGTSEYGFMLRRCDGVGDDGPLVPLRCRLIRAAAHDLHDSATRDAPRKFHSGGRHFTRVPTPVRVGCCQRNRSGGADRHPARQSDGLGARLDQVTDCGSLTGFADPRPAGISSMRPQIQAGQLRHMVRQRSSNASHIWSVTDVTRNWSVADVTRTDPHLTRSRRTFTVRLTTPALDGAAHGHTYAESFLQEKDALTVVRVPLVLLHNFRRNLNNSARSVLVSGSSGTSGSAAACRRRLSPTHRPSHCTPTPRGNLRHRLRIDHPVSGPHPTLRSEEPSRPCHRPILPAGPSRAPATDVHHRGGASEFAPSPTRFVGVDDRQAQQCDSRPPALVRTLDRFEPSRPAGHAGAGRRSTCVG